MSKADIVVLTNVSMITAVVQRGAADALVRAAREAGSEGATIYFGRGSGVRERLGILGLAVEAEKEIINILLHTNDSEFPAVNSNFFFQGIFSGSKECIGNFWTNNTNFRISSHVVFINESTVFYLSIGYYS